MTRHIQIFILIFSVISWSSISSSFAGDLVETKSGTDHSKHGFFDSLLAKLHITPKDYCKFHVSNSTQDGKFGFQLESRWKGDQAVLRIAKVLDGSRAQKAGIKAGDLITQIDDLPYDNPIEMKTALERHSGESAKLAILRVNEEKGDKELTVTVTAR